MKHPLLKKVFWHALLYFLLYQGLSALIFLLSHIPPKAISLDPVILGLFKVERVLTFPRFVLRALWPGESTPTGFNLAITIANCLIWGAAITGLRALWTKVRT